MKMRLGIQIVPSILSKVRIQMCLEHGRWRSMMEQTKGCCRWGFHRGLYYKVCMKELNILQEYAYICAYVRFTLLNGVIGPEFCAGAALGGTNLARFHSILLPLGSIMSLTKTYTACDILTPGKGTITGKWVFFPPSANLLRNLMNPDIKVKSAQNVWNKCWREASLYLLTLSISTHPILMGSWSGTGRESLFCRFLPILNGIVKHSFLLWGRKCQHCTLCILRLLFSPDSPSFFFFFPRLFRHGFCCGAPNVEHDSAAVVCRSVLKDIRALILIRTDRSLSCCKPKHHGRRRNQWKSRHSC